MLRLRGERFLKTKAINSGKSSRPLAATFGVSPMVLHFLFRNRFYERSNKWNAIWGKQLVPNLGLNTLRRSTAQSKSACLGSRKSGAPSLESKMRNDSLKWTASPPDELQRLVGLG